MRIKDIFSKNKEIFQLIYGIILIILIPLLIAINTITIISNYNDNFDVSIQRQAQAVGRSINVLLAKDIQDTATVQSKIEQLLKANPDDFQNIEILVPEGDNFKIIASGKKDNIEKVSKLDYYYYAWKRDINTGLATESLNLATTPEDKEMLDDFNSQGRFWLFAMPMTDENGNKQAILSIKLSSKIIDDLTTSTRNYSIYILIATILIVMLFLSIAIKLWDYVLLYKKIKEVDQMKDEFISIASHELRTPLGAIKGYVSLIIDGTFGEIKNKGMEQSLDKVMVSTDRLNTLVNDLLDTSRIEQGRLEINNEKTNIPPIINDTVDQLKVSADEKDLALTYEKPDDQLPDAIADEEKLKQVLINLIGNSIKYTEKGTITISTFIDNDKFAIKISDTGIGMSAEEQKHLFEKFHRVKNDKTKNITGTGLGLWITKQIVELMNGKIYVESMKNIGTQITIKLNIAKPAKK
ncbi:MAG: HAMP domain-containing histidine kinase [Candidatus Pacebacteria bacterium]|nr:HAMP domain-containing histidine kinase [Candidatus Paceibacterota bacterium]